MSDPGTMLIKELKPGEAFKVSDPELYFLRAINHLPYPIEIIVIAKQVTGGKA